MKAKDFCTHARTRAHTHTHTHTHIRSHASSGAACVNTVLPTDPGLQLTDAQWLTHQHLKHGLVTQPVHTRGSASVILRHDRLVGCVAKLLRSAGRAVRTEVRVEEKTEKRMDIVTTEGAQSPE